MSKKYKLSFRCCCFSFCYISDEHYHSCQELTYVLLYFPFSNLGHAEFYFALLQFPTSSLFFDLLIFQQSSHSVGGGHYLLLCNSSHGNTAFIFLPIREKTNKKGKIQETQIKLQSKEIVRRCNLITVLIYCYLIT